MGDLQLSVCQKIMRHSRNDIFVQKNAKVHPSERFVFTPLNACMQKMCCVHPGTASSELHLLSKNRELPVCIWENGAQTFARPQNVHVWQKK